MPAKSTGSVNSKIFWQNAHAYDSGIYVLNYVFITVDLLEIIQSVS